MKVSQTPNSALGLRLRESAPPLRHTSIGRRMGQILYIQSKVERCGFPGKPKGAKGFGVRNFLHSSCELGLLLDFEEVLEMGLREPSEHFEAVRPDDLSAHRVNRSTGPFGKCHAELLS